MRRWQTFSLFALSELVCTKKVFYHTLSPTYWPQADSHLECSRQTDKILHPCPCSLSNFFFHWSHGALPTIPTRRRNSTGLAELWGGWPIERALPSRPEFLYCYSCAEESHSTTIKPIALLVDDSDDSDVDHEQPTAALVSASSSSSFSGVGGGGQSARTDHRGAARTNEVLASELVGRQTLDEVWRIARTLPFGVHCALVWSPYVIFGKMWRSAT